MSAVQWLYAAIILNWIGLIGLAVTVVRLQDRLLERKLGSDPDDDGPAVGSQAPVLLGQASLRLPDSTGRVLPQLVWFMRRNCAPCQESRSIVKRIADAHQGKLECLVNFVGGADEVSALVQVWGAHVEIIADSARANVKQWRVRRAPFVFLVGEDGVIRWKGRGLSRAIESALAAHLEGPSIENGR
jgi:hypothetical protein